MNPHDVRHFLAMALVAFAPVLGGCGDENAPLDPGDQVPDTTPPAVPVNLEVAGDPRTASIQVAWDENAEPDLAGYVLVRSLDRGATWTTVSGTPLSIAAYQDAYYPRADYRVAALDQSDNQSAFSGTRSWIYIRNSGPKIPEQPVEP